MTALVAASEHALISLARALIAPHAGEAPVMLAGRRALPSHIGPACAELLADALRQLWPAIWRRGIRGGAGRSWQHHDPVSLAHTAATLDVLRWLISGSIGDGEVLEGKPLALGDEVIIYLALDAAGDTPARALIARQPLVRASALAWLGFAHVLSGEPPSFAPLADGAGAVLVEALARELAERWRHVELAKRAMTDPARVIAVGAGQDAVLGGYLAACERRRRHATWVLDAAAPLLAQGLVPAPLALDPKTSLAERVEARVAAGALLRAIVRWGAWDAEHRAVRFIDDDYDEAQRLLAAFERIGRAGTDRTVAWLADLASLAPTTPVASASIDGP